MSDTWQAPSWWMASDSKWYLPESAPFGRAPMPPEGTTGGRVQEGSTELQAASSAISALANG
jgi:hypothetical protein